MLEAMAVVVYKSYSELHMQLGRGSSTSDV